MPRSLPSLQTRGPTRPHTAASLVSMTPPRRVRLRVLGEGEEGGGGSEAGARSQQPRRSASSIARLRVASPPL